MLPPGMTLLTQGCSLWSPPLLKLWTYLLSCIVDPTYFLVSGTGHSPYAGNWICALCQAPLSHLLPPLLAFSFLPQPEFFLLDQAAGWLPVHISCLFLLPYSHGTVLVVSSSPSRSRRESSGVLHPFPSASSPLHETILKHSSSSSLSSSKPIMFNTAFLRHEVMQPCAMITQSGSSRQASFQSFYFSTSEPLVVSSRRDTCCRWCCCSYNLHLLVRGYVTNAMYCCGGEGGCLNAS